MKTFPTQHNSSQCFLPDSQQNLAHNVLFLPVRR